MCKSFSSSLIPLQPTTFKQQQQQKKKPLKFINNKLELQTLLYNASKYTLYIFSHVYPGMQKYNTEIHIDS